MAITYISSIERPDDGQTFGGNVNCSLLINAAGAATGDLVVVVAQYRAATTITVGETGGQTWNSLAQIIDAANLCQVRYFWCRWSDESANGNNPNWSAGGISGNPFTCVAHIFRPTNSSKLWGVDVVQASTQFTAPGSPFTVTRTGVSTSQASTITFASWHTADANTWNSLSGTGWSTPGTAQYRNLTGSAQSGTFAYKIMTSVGSTSDVSKNQAANGGDAGVSAIVSFYEYDATSPVAGVASGTSTALANIRGKGQIGGVSPGQSTATGLIHGKGNLSAMVAGSSTVIANIKGIALLSGLAEGTSNAIGAIIGKGFIAGIGSGSSAATIILGQGAGLIVISASSAIINSLHTPSIIYKNIITTSPIKNLI